MGGRSKKIESKHKFEKDTATIIPRDEWGAEEIKGRVTKLRHPVTYVRYGYTGTDKCFLQWKCQQILKEYQQKYLENGFADQPFNFLIGSDGIVYEGRGWDIEADRPEKLKKIKGQAIDIGFIGNYADDYKPTDKMIKTGELLVEMGLEERYIQQCPKILNLNDFEPLLEED